MDSKAYINENDDLCMEVVEGYNKNTWILNAVAAIKLADFIYDHYMPKEELGVDAGYKPKKKKYSPKKLYKLADRYVENIDDQSRKLLYLSVLWDFLGWVEDQEKEEGDEQ